MRVGIASRCTCRRLAGQELVWLGRVLGLRLRVGLGLGLGLGLGFYDQLPTAEESVGGSVGAAAAVRHWLRFGLGLELGLWGWGWGWGVGIGLEVGLGLGLGLGSGLGLGLGRGLGLGPGQGEGEGQGYRVRVKVRVRVRVRVRVTGSGLGSAVRKRLVLVVPMHLTGADGKQPVFAFDARLFPRFGRSSCLRPGFRHGLLCVRLDLYASAQEGRPPHRSDIPADGSACCRRACREGRPEDFYR